MNKCPRVSVSFENTFAAMQLRNVSWSPQAFPVPQAKRESVCKTAATSRAALLIAAEVLHGQATTAAPI